MLCCCSLVVGFGCWAQSITQRLDLATKKMALDPQLKHALFSFCVVEAKSGKLIYERNAEIGLAPASCQKLFTSIAALELLGPRYRYKTTLSYEGHIEDTLLEGNIYLSGHGDPTLGSWRWPQTTGTALLDGFTRSVVDAGIHRITGAVRILDTDFSIQPIPDGWIWQDIGNYYGAGSYGVNWNENQYDLLLQPGARPGESVSILGSTAPAAIRLTNQLLTGEVASGDNAYIYLPPYTSMGFMQGTIPAGTNTFHIAGSLPDPEALVCQLLDSSLRDHHVVVAGQPHLESIKRDRVASAPQTQTLLFTHLSPTLDSINYWFLKKSINLYAEALVKTIAFEKLGKGQTDTGVQLVRTFWASHGIEASAIQLVDGSGLSPQNRVTARALVDALRYARTCAWFNAFYDALPEINGMKMKSGSIGGVRSYAGYQASRDGKQYVFALLVNNFDGSPADLTRQMWTLLNQLK